MRTTPKILISLSIVLFLSSLAIADDQQLNTVQSGTKFSIGNFLLEFAKIFFSALLGATCAFAVERWVKKTEKKEQRIDACRKTQYALTCRINTLLNIRKKWLDHERGNVNRWIELHPLLITEHLHPTIPLDDLSFLLKTPDSDLLRDFFICIQKSDICFQTINLRNSMHVEFQKEYEGNYISLRLKTILEELTNELYENVDEAVGYLTQAQKDLGKCMKKYFPGCVILGLEEVQG